MISLHIHCLQDFSPRDLSDVFKQGQRFLTVTQTASVQDRSQGSASPLPCCTCLPRSPEWAVGKKWAWTSQNGQTLWGHSWGFHRCYQGMCSCRHSSWNVPQASVKVNGLFQQLLDVQCPVEHNGQPKPNDITTTHMNCTQVLLQYSWTFPRLRDRSPIPSYCSVTHTIWKTQVSSLPSIILISFFLFVFLFPKFPICRLLLDNYYKIPRLSKTIAENAMLPKPGKSKRIFLLPFNLNYFHIGEIRHLTIMNTTTYVNRLHKYNNRPRTHARTHIHTLSLASLLFKITGEFVAWYMLW